jgi:hypothetical protein
MTRWRDVSAHLSFELRGLAHFISPVKSKEFVKPRYFTNPFGAT